VSRIILRGQGEKKLKLFFQVLQFNNTYAGVILFVGQISDGVSTVFVGYFSDAGDDFFLCRAFGRRKAWHIFGTLCLLLTFPFVFLKCVGCQDSAQVSVGLMLDISQSVDRSILWRGNLNNSRHPKKGRRPITSVTYDARGR